MSPKSNEEFTLDDYLSNNLDADEQQQQQQMKLAQVYNPFAIRLHPGDDVYGSFKPIYPQHQALVATTDGTYGNMIVNGSSNDIYFLVTVAAFCTMAMAVVLAAGWFAYRVQQNRKATTETEYPTYGVVGPNNISGKCGAAAFVGGYFGSIAADSSASSLAGGGSKTGSIKHLPDVYTTNNNDTAVVTAVCGGASNVLSNKRSLNEQSTNEANSRSSDFMTNQNASRMYHYQQQKIISDRSDLDSDEENDDGSYTVYECRGLASAHEMEIKNPLFDDDKTTP